MANISKEVEHLNSLIYICKSTMEISNRTALNSWTITYEETQEWQQDMLTGIEHWKEMIKQLPVNLQDRAYYEMYLFLIDIDLLKQYKGVYIKEATKHNDLLTKHVRDKQKTQQAQPHHVSMTVEYNESQNTRTYLY